MSAPYDVYVSDHLHFIFYGDFVNNVRLRYMIILISITNRVVHSYTVAYSNSEIHISS